MRLGRGATPGRRRVSARLLVGADGAASRVRTLAGIGYERHGYDQRAVVCNVRTERPHEDTARQRFLAEGPLAYLPLDDAHMSSIVWSTTPAHAERLLALDAERKRQEAEAAARSQPSGNTPVERCGQLWEPCENCGKEPVYLPLHRCDSCWPG